MQKKNIRKNVVLLLTVLLTLCFGCTVQAETGHRHKKGDWQTEEILDDGKELQRKFCTICGEVMGERIVEAHKDHAAEPGDWEILEEPTCAKEGKKSA